MQDKTHIKRKSSITNYLNASTKFLRMETKTDLLLITPETGKRMYQGLATAYSAIETPWYAAATAAFVRNKGFNAKIIDANAENLSAEETAQLAKNIQPRLINIIAYGQQPSDSAQRMTAILEQCAAIKKINPKTPIILTGMYPSALPEKTLTEINCDFVGQGEGFYTVLGLLEEKPHPQVLGLWRKENGTIVGNGRAPNIENLDQEIPMPAYDLLPMNKYRAHNWQCLHDIENRGPYASIYTSLGCPFNCTFCCINSPFGKPGIRYWSPDTIIKQIDFLVKEYGVKIIKIIDEMFLLNKAHVEGIADRIIERGYKLNIWAYARVDTIKDVALLEKIKKAGINWLILGIESGSKHVRDGVEKGRFIDNDIVKSVRTVQKAGIYVMGNYIFGLPDDTNETMAQTLQLAQELNCEWANFYSAMAYPGSKLYEIAKQEGWHLPDDEGMKGCIGFSQHSYETLPLPTKTLSAAEVLKFRDYAHHAYYTSEKYLNLVRNTFGEKAYEHIKTMNAYKMKRKILGD